MKRLILSVIAGFLITAIPSVATDAVMHATGVFPPPEQPFMDDGLLLVAFIYRAIYAIIGAYFAAMLARDRARQAAITLGVIGTLLWLLGTIVMWHMARPWYNIGGIVTALPLVLIGWKLYERREAKRVSRS